MNEVVTTLEGFKTNPKRFSSGNGSRVSSVTFSSKVYHCIHLCLMLSVRPIRTRESLDPCLLCVPPISKRCSNSFFDRSFVYAAPTLWNALDLDMRLLHLDAFK